MTKKNNEESEAALEGAKSRLREQIHTILGSIAPGESRFKNIVSADTRGPISEIYFFFSYEQKFVHMLRLKV